LKRGEELLLQSVDRSSISIEEPNPLGFHIQWRNRMTKLKLLSAALIAAAALATPAMARESGVASRRVAADANASAAPSARYADGRFCTPVPAVGAFATQPWDSAPPCEPTSAY
jgi:hypothetical protein